MAITIVPEQTEGGKQVFRASSGAREAVGPTVGAALDALSAELPDDDISGTMIFVQRFEPDRFFGEPERSRLTALMAKWRQARDAGVPFPAVEQAELDALIKAETRAAIERAKALAK